VGHTKEFNAGAFRISKFEPSIILHEEPSFTQDRIFPEYLIRNLCGIRITYSELHQKLLVSGLHHKENVLGGGQVEKRAYTRFFDCNYGQVHNISHPLLLFLLQRCVFIVGLS